jgi:hypothetical protein
MQRVAEWFDSAARPEQQKFSIGTKKESTKPELNHKII